MRFVFTAILCYVWLLPEGFAQNQKLIDSLEEELYAYPQKDSVRVDLYNQLGFHYRKGDKAKAQLYLDSAIQLSKKLDYRKGLSGAYNRYGIIYKYKMQFDKAEEYYQKSIDIAKKYGDKKAEADVINNLGNIYRMQGEPVKATSAFLKALKIREETKDTAGAAAAYSNLSYVYSEQKNYALALENNNKSIELYKQVNDSFELARSYTNTVFIYYFQDMYDSAVYYSNIALDIFSALGDQSESAVLLNNTGNILTENGQAAKSILYHNRALNIQLQLNDSTGIYTSYLSLAQSYLFLNNYNKAEVYARDAINVVNNHGGSMEMFIDGYELLSKIYKAQGKYKEAYTAFEQYNNYRDSVINQDNTRAVTEMQEKYDSDKKDLLLKQRKLEIKNANSKVRQRNIVAASLFILLILLAITVYLLYNRFKLKKQHELNEEIIKQQSIRSKAVIDAEEKERTRIAKDLHDGIGQQLSAAKMLASSLGDTIGRVEHDEKLAVLRNTLDESIKEVRSVSHSMMPNALFKLGLSAAIREFINRISASGLLKIDLQIIGLDKELDKTTEIILYRVLQELVSNIIKHAEASKLDIQVIAHEDNMLNITVEDNGKGFDTNNLEVFEGIGLKNIISRIKYLNGSIHFDSTPGNGTMVIIDVPMSPL